MSATETERLWSTSEVARYLGVPETTLHRWTYDNKGPRSFKVGRHRRYRPSDVEAWLEDNANDPQATSSGG